MPSPRVAIIVDSCTDVPAAQIAQYGMYVLPLRVNFSEGSYRDRIDITPEEVCERLSTEIPKTSLPSMQEINTVFEQVLADGFTQAIAVTISSGLSGTYDTVCLVAKQFAELHPDFQCRVVDTRNIGLGAGFTALSAAQFIEDGVPFDELEPRLLSAVPDNKVFFNVETLVYLKSGGRINEITYLMGNLLNVSPIISCNAKGTYYVAAVARGQKHAFDKMIKLAQEKAAGLRKFNVAVMHAGAHDRAQQIVAKIHKWFPNACHIWEGQISPALVVHTGPGTIGIGIQSVSA